MSNFNEADHPRENAGRFAQKRRSTPDGQLSEPVASAAAPSRPFSIAVLDEPDPAGGYDLALEAPTGRYLMRDGKLHSEDGPAFTGDDGEVQWWRHGRRHRETGPAVVREDGTEEVWIDGEPVSI